MGKDASAVFSECRRYRYSLTRTWTRRSAKIMFIGLNPSTADENVDDPTVRRCIGFARQWGYGGIILTNLFAFRSTDPAVLKNIPDPIGPDNDQTIIRCYRSSARVVVAWGAHGALQGRDERVLSLLSAPLCLGVTKSGLPRHPLYLAATTRLREFSASRSAITFCSGDRPQRSRVGRHLRRTA
jgi:hypothetical protein